MHKYGFSLDTNKFEIDPTFLEEGLAVAVKEKYTAIRIRAQDSIDSKVELDVKLLSNQLWIKKLTINRDIKIAKIEDFSLLERLTGLEELNVFEHVPLDYSKFPYLNELVLIGGSKLTGLEKVSSLKILYLSRWKVESLPTNASSVSAHGVRVGASRKLKNIDPLYENTNIENLMLQDLPALHISKKINYLTSLKELHIEKVKGGDFDQFESSTLRKLFIWKLDSLKFIKKLEVLEEIFFWELADGDLRPVLEHPTLKEISFSTEKKHYSHKLQFLRDQLHAKHMGKR